MVCMLFCRKFVKKVDFFTPPSNTWVWVNFDAQTKPLPAVSRLLGRGVASKVKELFLNLADVPTVDLTTAVQVSAQTVDEEAKDFGQPFTQLANFGDGEGDAVAWVGWVDWEGLVRARVTVPQRGGVWLP